MARLRLLFLAERICTNYGFLVAGSTFWSGSRGARTTRCEEERRLRHQLRRLDHDPDLRRRCARYIVLEQQATIYREDQLMVIDRGNHRLERK